MRSPRLEMVLWLTVELIMCFIVVMFVVTVMENFLVINGVFPELDSEIDKVITYFVSMLGAVGVLVSATALTVSEAFEKKKLTES